MAHYATELIKYDVAIANLATIGGGSTPDDGTIDHKTPENADYNPSTLPTTDAQSLAKERANMRYKQMTFALNDLTTIVRIDSEVATGADGQNPATAFSFSVWYDRTSYLSVIVVAGDGASAATDAGGAGNELTGADAVKLLLARILNTDFTENRSVFDPDTIDGIPFANAVQVLPVTAGGIGTDVDDVYDEITVTAV